MSAKQADSRGVFQPVHIATPAGGTRSAIRTSAAQFPVDAAAGS